MPGNRKNKGKRIPLPKIASRSGDSGGGAGGSSGESGGSRGGVGGSGRGFVSSGSRGGVGGGSRNGGSGGTRGGRVGRAGSSRHDRVTNEYLRQLVDHEADRLTEQQNQIKLLQFVYAVDGQIKAIELEMYKLNIKQKHIKMCDFINYGATTNSAIYDIIMAEEAPAERGPDDDAECARCGEEDAPPPPDPDLEDDSEDEASSCAPVDDADEASCAEAEDAPSEGSPDGENHAQDAPTDDETSSDDEERPAANQQVPRPVPTYVMVAPQLPTYVILAPPSVLQLQPGVGQPGLRPQGAGSGHGAGQPPSAPPAPDAQHPPPPPASNTTGPAQSTPTLANLAAAFADLMSMEAVEERNDNAEAHKDPKD